MVQLDLVAFADEAIALILFNENPIAFPLFGHKPKQSLAQGYQMRSHSLGSDAKRSHFYHIQLK
jgi:hypothetical protein